MYPFWETVIAPLVEAAGARRIVEIGALRGDTTVLMLDALAPDSELHVIDPVPEFDPSEHERRFPGRYVFHRDLSLNVLDRCGAFDIALIDGDHNWYTVYNELRTLRETSRHAGEPLPVLVLHDVGWPYGRRDLYYAPEQIPAEFRQPYAQRGMRPDRAGLLPRGGMNVTLHNALREGGPRNGVMTALDDFLTDLDRPVRRVVLPMYFGLAIVVDEERLERTPRLRAELDRLESPAGKEALIELGEQIRLDAALWEQNVLRFREGQVDRAAQRYLELLKGAVLDEHYLENEVRIAYLLRARERGNALNADLVRDPSRFLRKETLQLRHARRLGKTAGMHASDDADAANAYFPYTTMGRDRLTDLEGVLQSIRTTGVAGDIAECGCGRGGAAIFARGFLEAYEISDRRVWVADEFRAAPEGGARPIETGAVDDLWADLNQVREGFAAFGLLDDQVRFLQGRFDHTLPDSPIEQLALIRIGAGTGRHAHAVLDHLYGRLAVGGYVVVEDDADEACTTAVAEFRARHGIDEPVERAGLSGTVWRKLRDHSTGTVRSAGTARPPSDRRDVPERAPLAPAAPTDAIDLSVVVVFYNMRREAARTLESLSRAYQREIDDLTYEVIVVENGSDSDQRLDEEQVRAFGPEFRYVDMGADAPASPTVALNHGIRLGRGKAFALMIDGAHVLTPGLLRHGMVGLGSYAPALVATQQWYVGPGQQPEAVASGYDTTDEDALFEHIAWPKDGYRLFEIGHFIGERDWLDGILESNCVFVPRALLEQVGGFDDSFSMPGGGYANLELYERLGSSPDVTVVTIIGEGSFHQVHGGTTTNDALRDDRRSKVVAYSDHYRERHGRQLRGPVKAMHYVGSFSSRSAWRTRSRRMSAESFSRPGLTEGPDGLPTKPALLPEELKRSFIEAYWNSLAWTHTNWLGHAVPKTPTDLMAYQELIVATQPDWIIETGTGAGGRALFFASLCDLLGHGQVVSIDDAASPDVPEHARITYVSARAHSEQAADKVRAITESTTNAFVVLGSRTEVGRTIQEFERYAAFVGVGSFVVVEDTLVNGHPVWPGFGNGPHEAIARILAKHPAFVQDISIERHGLTFNPGGFLRRVSE